MSTKLFNEVFKKWNYRCVYCGRDMLADLDSFMSVQEDHLVPQSKGGETDTKNLVISCNVCNNLKGSFNPEEAGKADNEEYLKRARVYIAEQRAIWTESLLNWNKYRSDHTI